MVGAGPGNALLPAGRSTSRTVGEFAPEQGPVRPFRSPPTAGDGSAPGVVAGPDAAAVDAVFQAGPAAPVGLSGNEPLMSVGPEQALPGTAPAPVLAASAAPRPAGRLTMADLVALALAEVGVLGAAWDEQLGGDESSRRRRPWR